MSQQQFGRYIIIRELGRGGMGAVYLAHDPHFERGIALKILPHALLHDPTFRQRFSNEAKMIASLEHQAIVPVYDYGEHQGQPFLVMRLMRGGSLTKRLAQGPLSLAEANTILQRICAALDKAHAKKIVHRDLKPDNILFDEDDAAYLADFGIAKLVENTQTMTIIGTPQYMSPEQAQGHPIDARTDVYQMGVVLFEMLTGRVPFDAPNPAALLHEHAYSPIPSAQALNSNLPPACDTVIAKAMAKKQDERFATAGELAKALAMILLPKPPPPSPPTPLPPVPKQKRQLPRWGIIGGIFAVLALFMMLLLVINSYDSATRAEEQAARARRALATAQAVHPLIETASNWPLILYDSFDTNDAGWSTGDNKYELVKQSQSLAHGKYVWEAEALSGVISWLPEPTDESFTDFYLTVEVARVNGETGQQGLMFRRTGANHYVFMLCSDLRRYLFGMWHEGRLSILISCTSHSAIRPSGSNKLTVIGEGANFTFFINDQYVDEFTHDRISKGSVGVTIELYNEGDEATFEFDNFEVRKR